MSLILEKETLLEPKSQSESDEEFFWSHKKYVEKRIDELTEIIAEPETETENE